MNKQTKRTPSLPSKAEILAFIADHKGKVGTREIARAFGLKNAMRAELKRMLRDLADDGTVEKRRKKLHHAGTLPSTVLADVTARDSDGDLIATPDEWDEEAHGAAPKIRIHTPRKARPGEAAGVGDRVLLHIEETEEDNGIRHRGRVIKIIDHPKHRVLGIFRKAAAWRRQARAGRQEDARQGTQHSGERHRRRAGRRPGRGRDQPRAAPGAADRTRGGAARLAGERARGQPDRHPLPIRSRMCSVTTPQAEAEAARPATLAHREDWRHVPLITIDPPDAKDHDDAVHAEHDTAANNHGGFIVSVAIADVAHYVTPGSALDREALVRGNSVYFPDRVVPMLPERISNDLCSLRPREDRAALAVRMVIGADGRKRSHTFHRVMMRSAAKLSYQQAQFAISGRTDEDTEALVQPVLAPLYAAYETLTRARIERGPLDLDLPERKILLKGDGTVDRVTTPERLEAHRLIEEFMILANVAAAETLEKARVPLIYRVHDEPGMEKVNALREFLATLDIPFAKGGVLRADSFNRVLAQAKGRDAEQLINDVVLRTQAQAEYAAENYGHFGLNLRRYAHFTSPIRRYADLIVHRGLIRALKLGPRRPARGDGQQGAGRDRRADFRDRAARHAGGTRNQRPADRAFPVRPRRRHLRRPRLRRAPRRPVREAERDRRRRLRAGAHHRQRIFPPRRGRPCHGRLAFGRDLSPRRPRHRQAGGSGPGCRRAAL